MAWHLPCSEVPFLLLLLLEVTSPITLNSNDSSLHACTNAVDSAAWFHPPCLQLWPRTLCPPTPLSHSCRCAPSLPHWAWSPASAAAAWWRHWTDRRTPTPCECQKQVCRRGRGEGLCWGWEGAGKGLGRGWEHRIRCELQPGPFAGIQSDALCACPASPHLQACTASPLRACWCSAACGSTTHGRWRTSLWRSSQHCGLCCWARRWR